MHKSILKTTLLTISVVPGILGLAERSTCRGAMQGGYCCNGSILKKDHSNDLSASNLICCEGDSPAINFANNAPTSCTAGTQVPLTEASDGSSSQSTGTSAASSSAAAGSSSASVDSSSANDAVRAMVTTAPLIGAMAVAGGLLMAA